MTKKIVCSAALVSVVAGLFCSSNCALAAGDSGNGGGISVSPVLSKPSSFGSLGGGTQSTTLQTGAQSTTLQTGTDSTMLQTGTQSTMLQTGTQSTMLQTGTQSTMLQTGTQSSLIQGGVERKGGPINVLFLVDCSLSMRDKIKGAEQKMTAAKQVLQSAMSKIPNDINLGLRVFGQGMTMAGMDCRATALLVPIGQGNRRSIIDKVNNLRPFGLTPLTYAIRQAAMDDFADVRGTKTLILITDGVDTCGEDPCSFIRELPNYGIKVKVDVVGLDIHEHAGKMELNCIAETSGGKYYDANTAGQLIDSVSASVNNAVSGQVLTPGGKNTETPPELQPIQPFMAH